MTTEINATIEEVEETTPKKIGKDMRGKRNYDGSTPLLDPQQEEYINKILFYLGDRLRAYEEVYQPDTTARLYTGKPAYKFFERKNFVKRYQYLTNVAMLSAGLDRKTLLLKAATMVDKSVKSHKVREFTQLVDTILKLQSANPKNMPEQIKVITAEKVDLAPVKELLEELNG